jgi:protein-tyrosine-phosphatase
MTYVAPDPMASAPLELRPLIRGVAATLRQEFAGTFGPETIQRFMAESYEAFAGRPVTAFLPVLVERFTRQRLRALARAEGSSTSTVPAVVFLCVHNAGRSQMAAGWLQHLGGDGVEVYSGGSDPAGEVNPAAVAAMAEVGIDIASEFPKPWTDEVIRGSDVVVTMGCGDACPVYPGKTYQDWELTDPAGLGVDAVRPIRDEIGQRVRALMAELRVPARA